MLVQKEASLYAGHSKPVTLTMTISNDLWKTEAIQLFPDLAERFPDTDTPYFLWFELFDAFSGGVQKST